MKTRIKLVCSLKYVQICDVEGGIVNFGISRQQNVHQQGSSSSGEVGRQSRHVALGYPKSTDNQKEVEGGNQNDF